MRLIATVLACLSLSACAGLPTQPPLGQVLVITGAVIAAGAIAEHRQANHLVPPNDRIGGDAADPAPSRSAPPRRPEPLPLARHGADPPKS